MQMELPFIGMELLAVRNEMQLNSLLSGCGNGMQQPLGSRLSEGWMLGAEHASRFQIPETSNLRAGHASKKCIARCGLLHVSHCNTPGRKEKGAKPY